MITRGLLALVVAGFGALPWVYNPAELPGFPDIMLLGVGMGLAWIILVNQAPPKT